MLATVRGVLAFTGYIFNTVLIVPIVALLGVLKLIPLPPLQKLLTLIIDQLGTLWISINNLNQRLLSKTKVITHNLPEMSNKQWYLVIANHQSWVDILILQRVLNRKVPFLKFFLKKELLYVPLLGLAWWALDFPFMRRYSASFLKKNPHLKGKDQEATRKACEKFHYKPVSVMNFVEGTRFTQAKHQRQSSPYDKLLKPKSGGIAMSLDAMGGKLDTMLDVTICYPDGVPTFWEYICGRVRRVEVTVDTHCLAQMNQLSYECREDRSQFQGWLNQIWAQKAVKLAALENGSLTTS